MSLLYLQCAGVERLSYSYSSVTLGIEVPSLYLVFFMFSTIQIGVPIVTEVFTLETIHKNFYNFIFFFAAGCVFPMDAALFVFVTFLIFLIFCSLNVVYVPVRLCDLPELILDSIPVLQKRH